MTIPFLNLRALHEPIREELHAAMQEVIDASAFAGGPFVEKFEKVFAPYCQCEHAVGVGSGTDALWLALLALGVGPGDEVITVPNTFIATAEAISFCGATPVFVDVDERTYNMDPKRLEAAISPKTKAVIPVHLYGQVSDMDPILAVARQHRIPVLEDASQAHGAEYQGRRAGSMGVAGCFSFYPGKNLGAFGEAGAVVTQDEALAEKIRVLRDHGQIKKYHHSMVGWNGRMDGLQGAVLKVKLEYLDQGNERRRALARRYTDGLSDVPEVHTPYEMSSGRSVHHLYVIRIAGRDALMRHLANRGIGCAIHYPVPLHLTEAYRFLGVKAGRFPVAERCAQEIVSLPIFPDLREKEVDTVVEAVRSFASGKSAER